MKSPAKALGQDDVQVGVLVPDLVQNLLNHLVPLLGASQDLLDLVGVAHLGLESAGGDVLEGLSLRLETECVEQGLGLVHLGSEQLVVVLLRHLVLLVGHVSQSLDLVVDVLELLESLVDGRVQLHGVLGSVLESLLEVGDLSAQLSLGGYAIML